MTALATAIQERLDELGWQRKTLAHAWFERVGNGSLSTFVTRLSKLMNDDQDGYDFLLEDTQDRLAGLAEPLGWTPKKLRGLIDADLARPTLILHPQLPEAVAAFLLKRQESGAYQVHSVAVDGAASDGGVREVLKDTAQSTRNAFVVIPDSSRDHDFFKGASVRTTRVEPANPGYKLVALPDLIQPLAPRLHDDDGMPMVPDEEVEQSYREALNPRARDPYGRPRERPSEADPRVRAIRQADAEGRLATFRLEDVEHRHGWFPSPGQIKIRALQDALERAFPEKARERRSYHSHEKRQEGPWVWPKGRDVLVLGPESDAVKDIALHHRLHHVESFELIVDALAKVMPTLNPDGDGGTLALSRELGAFEEETGISLEIQKDEARAMLAPRSKTEFAKGESIRVSHEAEGRVRAVLDDILSREFILPEEHLPTVFVLQAIRNSPLIQIAAKSGELSAVANVGAGRLVRFETITFASEAPAPVKVVKSYDQRGEFDGGNVRFTVRPLFEQNLEGCVLRSVGRRRAEEAARASDDDYHDD